jgi:hypothetical protein
VNAGTLGGPAGVALDGAGSMFIADSSNNRALEYNTPLDPGSGEVGAGDTTADAELGQVGSHMPE